jgi:NADPH-dependent 2,4-dienoyl-CoA reductase/sulfur reductase-like enzyme
MKMSREQATMNEQLPKNKTILESAKEVNIFTEAEVVVVGGGPGGLSAAIAAARNGAKTVLIERYGRR